MGAIFVVLSVGARNARGWNWCSNEHNEAEYCGLCGKNEEGEMFPYHNK